MLTVLGKKNLALIAILITISLVLILNFGSLKKPTLWKSDNSLIASNSVPLKFESTSVDTLLKSLSQSISYYQSLPKKDLIQFGPDSVTVAHMIDSLDNFKKKLTQLGFSKELDSYLRSNFSFYKSAAPEILFTGYYEPSLHGSRAKNDKYKYPLYKKPEELVSIDLKNFLADKKILESLDSQKLYGRLTPNRELVPFYTRQEIDYQGSLANKNLELLWIDNLIDVFFSHIQGSGKVDLDDGSSLHVGYAGKNGRPYRSIGRLLLEEKHLLPGQVNMFSIKSYLSEHPGELEKIFSYNPSYVFFHVTAEGPFGALGQKLTPMRSIATDLNLFPKGALALVEVPLPNPDNTSWSLTQLLVCNQDTGGAIRGPGRVDLFTGSSKSASYTAGHLQHPGSLYFLKPN